eukprot:scaffold117453_cov17-Tisochrysis_lutea.AAC.1
MPQCFSGRGPMVVLSRLSDGDRSWIPVHEAMDPHRLKLQVEDPCSTGNRWVPAVSTALFSCWGQRSAGTFVLAAQSRKLRATHADLDFQDLAAITKMSPTNKQPAPYIALQSRVTDWVSVGTCGGEAYTLQLLM